MLIKSGSLFFRFSLFVSFFGGVRFVCGGAPFFCLPSALAFSRFSALAFVSFLFSRSAARFCARLFAFFSVCFFVLLFLFVLSSALLFPRSLLLARFCARARFLFFLSPRLCARSFRACFFVRVLLRLVSFARSALVFVF